MDISAATGALSGVKTVYDLAKGALRLSTATEVRLAISDMLDKLVDAKRAALEAVENEEALLKRISELEAEIGRVKTQAAELENYEPRSFHPGVTAYVLKPALAADKHPHKICANCYGKGIKSELHATGKQERRYLQHLCPSCKTEYFMGGEAAVSASGSTAGSKFGRLELSRGRGLSMSRPAYRRWPIFMRSWTRSPTQWPT